ncbi:MAG: TolC family protein [Nannocystaceae bacterium]|nr:TolC family protein [Nannocystaceae bacterium]
MLAAAPGAAAAVPPPRPGPADVIVDDVGADAAVSTLSIDDAIDRALRSNLALIAEREQVPIARAERLSARVRLNPVLSFGADHLDVLGTRYDDTNRAGPQEFFVRGDFGIMTGAKRKRRREHAEAAVTLAEHRVRDAVRLLVLDVANACVDVQLAAELRALARRNQELYQGMVALDESRVAAGDIAPVELTRIRIAAEQAGNAMLVAQAELEVARNRLALLLDSPEPLGVHEALRREGEVPKLAELRTIAARSRPDLQVARDEQRRSGVDIKRQIAEGKIDMSVGVELRRQQGLAGTGNSAGVFVSVPLPTSDRNQGGIERARRQQRAATAGTAATSRAVQTDVDDAHVAWRFAKARLARYEGGVLSQAEEVLATVAYSYRRGEAGLVDLIDAQRAHAEVQRSYIAARADYARALYTLEAATGEALSR